MLVYWERTSETSAHPARPWSLLVIYVSYCGLSSFIQDTFVADTGKLRGIEWMIEKRKIKFDNAMTGYNTWLDMKAIGSWDFPILLYFPPASAIQGIKSVPSVGACLSVSTLLAESFDVTSDNTDKEGTTREGRQHSGFFIFWSVRLKYLILW